ncbi:MAG: type IV pilin N-terminal domain-containing protein [Candidatus Thermoplasmatota archaeon]
MLKIRKLENKNDAVSAVIGVILMVAITVAIAATVYVYVSGMIGTGLTKSEDASVTVTGTNKQIKVMLAKGGANAPYTNTSGDTGFDLFINGTKLDTSTWSLGDGKWDTGESIILDENENNNPIRAGNKYALTVQIMGSTVYDSYVTVTS